MKFKPLSALTLILFLALSNGGFSQIRDVKKQSQAPQPQAPVEQKQSPIELKHVTMNERKVQDPNHRDLKWKAPQIIQGRAEDSRKFLYFDGAGYPTQNKGLPSFTETIRFNKNDED